MTTIQVRIDEKTKKSATKILNQLGLDMSGAIKMYLKQIITRNGLPFRVVTENGLTLEQEREILQASEEAKRGINVSRPMSPEEFIDELKGMMEKDGDNISQDI